MLCTVALPVPSIGALTYRLLDGQPAPPAGARILVPLGRRVMTGIVVGLNADMVIVNAGLIPNIKENPRNRKAPKRGRKRLFNQAIHALRDRVERTFAWEDKFKRLLLRFEHI